jgi:SAM-dependent methyltransferase
VLEIGFGPGLAIAEAARRASAGKVCGIDRSELMLKQAVRRNRKAVDARRADLRLGAAEHLPEFGVHFDKVFAVNVFMFWGDPDVVLRGLRGQMSAGRTIALTLQPRSKEPPTTIREQRRLPWRRRYAEPGSRT